MDQTYSPVVDLTTVRTCLAIAVQRGYSIHQMDVRTAFLHREIDGNVYVTPRAGSYVTLKDGEAPKLNKVLYGLRQAPRLWFDKLSQVMTDINALAMQADPCLFRLKKVWILLYVDDVILISPSGKEILEVKEKLSKTLDMKDLAGIFLAWNLFGWITVHGYHRSSTHARFSVVTVWKNADQSQPRLLWMEERTSAIQKRVTPDV